MDESGQLHELRTIKKEYELLFSTIELVRRSNSISLRFDSDDYYSNILKKRINSEENHLKIVTNDDNNIKITVNSKGWCQLGINSNYINESDRVYYETFETLMMSVSPDFQAGFSQSISNKLHGLLDLQPMTNSDDDNDYNNNV